MQNIANGDEISFRVIYDRYHQFLGSYIYQLTRSTNETEEIVQDVFLKLWMTREALNSVENIRSYLFIISKNHALNVIARRMREIAQTKKWQTEQKNNPVSNEERDILYSLIDKAISALPLQQKKVFLLSRHERLTYAEIAEKLRISRETVKTYLQLATASITKYIHEQHMELMLLLLIIKAAKKILIFFTPFFY